MMKEEDKKEKSPNTSDLTIFIASFVEYTED